MRLIDADKVKRAFIGNRYGTKAIEYVIDEAPTEKAIPIEWILNHPKFPHKNEDRKKCILDMIADWEKENES